MANTARTQMALAASPHFQSRIEAALLKIAFQVIDEDPNTPNHAQRVAFAQLVRINPGGYAATLAPSLAMRTNVFAFATSYDFEIGSVVTASGDPDIESQMATDWDLMAGV